MKLKLELEGDEYPSPQIIEAIKTAAAIIKENPGLESYEFPIYMGSSKVASADAHGKTSEDTIEPFCVSAETLACRYDVCLRTVRKWQRRKWVPSSKLGGTVRFPVRECDALWTAGVLR